MLRKVTRVPGNDACSAFIALGWKGSPTRRRFGVLGLNPVRRALVDHPEDWIVQPLYLQDLLGSGCPRFPRQIGATVADDPKAWSVCWMVAIFPSSSVFSHRNSSP